MKLLCIIASIKQYTIMWPWSSRSFLNPGPVQFGLFISHLQKSFMFKFHSFIINFKLNVIYELKSCLVGSSWSFLLKELLCPSLKTIHLEILEIKKLWPTFKIMDGNRNGSDAATIAIA